MKHMLSTMALCFSFVMLAVATLLGFRVWATLGRVFVVFVSTYLVGLGVSLVIAMSYMSAQERAAKEREALAAAEAAAPEPQGGNA